MVEATAVETEVHELPLDVRTPEEQVITGVPEQDIEALLYLVYPEIITARKFISPVIVKLVSKLEPTDTIEAEEKVMNEFTPTCFHGTYDQLMNRMEPIDDDIQRALGSASEAFPLTYAQSTQYIPEYWSSNGCSRSRDG